MGDFGGSYTTDPRSVLDEQKRYMGLLCQQDIPWSELEENLGLYIFLSLIRRVSQLFGTGALGDAWKMVGSGAANNFALTGGGGTSDTALTLWLKGYRVPLFSTVNYDNTGSTIEEKSIHSRSSGLTATVLSDSSANWIVDELVDRRLRPNITNASSFLIIANTENTITVTGGDMTTVAAVLDHYLIELTTPSGANRGDEVFLNIYLDEISPTDDPAIIRTIEGSPTECKRPLQLVSVVHVRQGDPTDMADYVDSNGNQHYVTKLGAIQRVDGQDAINSGEITDERPLIDTITNLMIMLDQAAAFCGAANGFPLLPVYSQENYITDGDSLMVAVDLLDQALYVATKEQARSVIAPQHNRYNTIADAFADTTLPANSSVVVLSHDDTGTLVILTPDNALTGIRLFVQELMASFNQNGGRIGEISGQGFNSTVRSILIDANIRLGNLAFDNEDSQGTYGIRLTGATTLSITFHQCLVSVAIDESSRTGATNFLAFLSDFNGAITLTNLTSITVHRSQFYNTLTLSAVAPITGTISGSILASVPVLTNITLDMLDCTIAGIHYAYAKVTSAGVVEGAARLPSLTTALRDGMASPQVGYTILNSTLAIPQSRNNNSIWLDQVARMDRKFYYMAAAAGLTGAAMFWESGMAEFRVPYDAYIVALVVHVSGTCTAGTLTAKPRVNGSAVSTTALDAVIDGTTNPNDNHAKAAPGSDANLAVTEGQKVGVQITTTAGFLPIGMNAFAFVHLVSRS